MDVFVDGDIVVYRCAFAAEHTKYVLTDEVGQPIAGPFDSAAERKEYVEEHQGAELLISESYKEYEPLSHALANVKSVMKRIMDVGDLRGVFLSKGECYRHKLATIKKYKGNRDDAPRPKYYAEVRQYLIDHYGALVFESIEADDALAMCQHDDSIIASIDKDLLQVPGYHFNFVHAADKTDRTGKVLITPEVGYRKLMMQVLTGDGTDNIPGIRGVGEKTARKLLADTPNKGLVSMCLDLWDDYLEGPAEKYIDDLVQDGDEYEYTHWNDDIHIPCRGSASDIMREVYELVKVGGTYAEAAAHKSGEDVSLPRST